MIVPFVLLLGAIALGPLVGGQLWQRHYGKVSFGLGAVTLWYYLGVLHAHHRVLEVAHEYVSFIALIGSLFIVSGGIHIAVKGEATPRTNTIFLGIGAVVANLLGTTGASMLLIRPWIRMNKYRITAHHIVFFIFIVSNTGGCLTPIGDPPLFLGYLKGIPFWWVTEHCWPMWAVGVSMLLAIFYIVDSLNYRRAPKHIRAEHAEPPDQWRIEGLWNLLFLGVILGAVFIERPLFLREALMVGAAAASYLTTNRRIHEANHFNFHPIKEVAVLFAGIFATMIPALDWLQLNAGRAGLSGPGVLFWSCGLLSSVLDNAPTYLSFLSAIFGAAVDQHTVEQVRQLIQAHGAPAAEALGQYPESVASTLAALKAYYSGALASGNLTHTQIEVAYLIGNSELKNYILAISVGAVFFGANTYIGNGPNFMVKSIADHQRVNTPTFLGYVFKYTLPFMLPVLIVVWALFFRD
ncbi:MAG: sodium:proton antiporter [Verrucomicrobiae bacterium]|nr:sodium:proton antiporter [Verrucomicrobiae bacterium]